MSFKSLQNAVPASITESPKKWLVSGDLLINNASGLLDKSESLDMSAHLEIDFKAVTDADTSALGLLLAWQRRANAQKSTLKIVNMPANLLSLVDLYGIKAFISF